MVVQKLGIVMMNKNKFVMHHLSMEIIRYLYVAFEPMLVIVKLFYCSMGFEEFLFPSVHKMAHLFQIQTL